MGGPAAFDLSWIAEDVAVGGALPPGGAPRLGAQEGVGFVVDMRAEACDEAAEFAAAGVRLLPLPTVDHAAPRQDQLDAGVAFAEEARMAGGRLLIHCQHGIGRSATLALCVLAHRGREPLAALLAAKEVRAVVSPSPAQYEAWVQWMRRRTPEAAAPDFDSFKAIAYRHLTIGA